MIRIGRFSLWAIKRYIEHVNKKKRKKFPLDVFPCKLDYPFIDDGNEFHKMDIVYAQENKKNACIIDIHGGAYMYSRHRDNYMFGLEFVKAGYDFVAIDYIPNNGKMDTKDLISDCVVALKYIFSHLKELDLENREFFLTGDSAGGHFALLLSEMIMSKEVCETLGYEPFDVNIKGVLLNCPVYNFEAMENSTLKKSGLKRMFGKKGLDRSWMRHLSPRTYISSFSLPIFVSTCKHDFLRNESLLLQKEYDPKLLTFIDLDTDDKGVDHVHNVLRTTNKHSIYINNKMIEFMDNILKR